MAKYLLLLDGVDDGCDYTIDCNKTWKFLDARDSDDATRQSLDVLRNYSPPGRSATPQKVTLILVGDEFAVNPEPVWEEKRTAERAYKIAENQKRIAALQAENARLSR